MDAAGLVDQLARGPVLVFGSLPPAGRDLDLLVPDSEVGPLREGLVAAGFEAAGPAELARFAGCSVEAVDLVPASDWRLPDAELAELWAQARPIDGYSQLRQPAPAHALLILARRCARQGRLADKHRQRALDSAREDPQAWARARAAAAGWRAEASLRQLQDALAGRRPRAWRVSRAQSLARRRPGILVTLSGLDGSGKSTQAEALGKSLERLGYPSVLVWTSVTAHGALPAVAGVVRAVLRMAGRRAATADDHQSALSPRADVGIQSPAEDPGRSVRQRSRLLGWAWITFVALTNGWWQSRATRGQLLRGRVVICDRWLLDSYVHMRYAYGEDRSYRLPLALIRALSPRPARSYLLDVSPEVVYARNQEYAPTDVARRARYYRDGYSALGVRRLDGERPVEELCELIARDVVAALRER
jgi:thymidylate kinase